MIVSRTGLIQLTSATRRTISLCIHTQCHEPPSMQSKSPPHGRTPRQAGAASAYLGSAVAKQMRRSPNFAAEEDDMGSREDLRSRAVKACMSSLQKLWLRIPLQWIRLLRGNFHICGTSLCALRTGSVHSFWVVWALHMGVSKKMRDPVFFRSPHNEDHSMLGSVLGHPIFGNSHIGSTSSF